MSTFYPVFRGGARNRDAKGYVQSLPQLDGVDFWFRSDRGLGVVESNKASSWTDIIGARVAVSNTTDRRPLLLPDKIGGKSALVFDGIDDNMVFSSLTGDGFFASAFSLGLVLQVQTAPTDTRYILSNFNGTDNPGTLIALRAGGLMRFSHGTGYVETAVPIGVPIVLIVSMSGGFLRGRLNGVNMRSLLGDVAAKSDLAHGVMPIVMGALSNVTPVTAAAAFAVTDFIGFARDIITDGPTCNRIEEYAGVRYRAGLTY